MEIPCLKICFQPGCKPKTKQKSVKKNKSTKLNIWIPFWTWSFKCWWCPSSAPDGATGRSDPYTHRLVRAGRCCRGQQMYTASGRPSFTFPTAKCEWQQKATATCLRMKRIYQVSNFLFNIYSKVAFSESTETRSLNTPCKTHRWPPSRLFVIASLSQTPWLIVVVAKPFSKRSPGWASSSCCAKNLTAWRHRPVNEFRLHAS